VGLSFSLGAVLSGNWACVLIALRRGRHTGGFPKRRGDAMWFFNGIGWVFVSLASPRLQDVIAPLRQTIHELPVPVPEYLALIREHCD